MTLSRLSTISDDKKEKYLEILPKYRYISRACNALGIDRTLPYYWEKVDPEFKTRHEIALKESERFLLEDLETEIDKRATVGAEIPLTYKGEIVGSYNQPSDNLLMFRTKALAPEKYRDNPKLEVSGQVAHTYNITIQGSETDRRELERTIAGELIEGEFTTEGD